MIYKIPKSHKNHWDFYSPKILWPPALRTEKSILRESHLFWTRSPGVAGHHSSPVSPCGTVETCGNTGCDTDDIPIYSLQISYGLLWFPMVSSLSIFFFCDQYSWFSAIAELHWSLSDLCGYPNGTSEVTTSPLLARVRHTATQQSLL